MTFEGLAKLCAQAMGISADGFNIKLYDKKEFDFGKKKAFPMREKHFFCSIDQPVRDLHWYPQYSLAARQLRQ